MRPYSNKIYLVVLALALSVAIIRWNSVGNVPFCVESAACHFDMEPKGTITKRYYGYPLSYKTTSTFNPINNDEKQPNYVGYAEATAELQKLSIINIIINTIFWFGLLKLVMELLPHKVSNTIKK